MITVGIPVTTRFDLFRKAVLSLLDSERKPDTLIVFDQRDGCPAELYQELARALRDARIRLIRLVPERQVSLAAAWNQLVLNAEQDWVILANDDVEVEPNTIGSLIQAAQEQPDELVFVSPQDPVNEFSLFLIRQRAFDVVGPFDEEWWPVFHEDADYRHRMKLLGYHVVRVPGCVYRHVHSATLKAKTPEEQAQHWQQFHAMRQRYISKWGGPPGDEVYVQPFNGNVEFADSSDMPPRRTVANGVDGA